ncbi:hypothetical protein [Demequina activiva]|uniref:Uncharacterized protein n=1 Tax=Demequina activiva TaxID=1582364 RepID=A0A919Q4F1_9MICO|nr:hypothetical protein [Demequina activiva]GIG55007.1 hypothetical protein Dac01nite_17590 [Demequina activiva]
MKREFVGILDDVNGGIWFIVRAESAERVSRALPQLHVFEIAEAPSVEMMDLDRLRAQVGAGVDPREPVADRDLAAQEEFLRYRERVMEQLRDVEARSQVPREVRERVAPLPRWLDIDDCGELAAYLKTRGGAGPSASAATRAQRSRRD